MKSRLLILISASGIFLTGCAVPPASSRPPVFDALHPGGPVYAPQEIVVPSAPPADAPYGTYFEGTDDPAPAAFSDPYWISGYWAWSDPDWVWVRGTWVDRPRPGLLWIRASALTIGSHTYWKTGYWQ